MYLLKKEELFIGKPAPLKEICLVYPLSAYQVLNLTQEKYNLYLNLLTMSDEDLKDIFEEKKIEYNNETVFSHIMTGCANDGNFLLDVKRAFFTFIREKVQILPESGVIIVGNIKEKRIIDENAFLELQNILRLQNRIELEELPPENEDEMHKKFRLRRKALKKAKKKKAQKEANSENSIDFYAIIKSLIINKVINYEDLDKFCVFAIHELFDMAQAQEEYKNQIRFICAGADSKKMKLKYWIKNSYEK